MPHPPKPRPWPLALLALAACTDSRMNRFAEGVGAFGEAMQTLAYIVLAFAAVAALLYLSLWWAWIVSWRRGAPSIVLACLLFGIQGFFVLAAGADRELDLYLWVLGLSVLPAAAFAVSFSPLRPRRAGAFAAALGVLCLVPHGSPPMRALPAPIVEAAGGFLHACARLESGRIACLGVDSSGERGDGELEEWRHPSLVLGIDDAVGVRVASSVSCALRRNGPALCWGGMGVMPVREPREPWPLPGGDDALDLALSGAQILILTRSGDLRAWPHRLPEGLTAARSIAAADAIDDAFAALDRDGVLWAWIQERDQIDALQRVPGLAAATQVAVHDGPEACVLLPDAVECFDWDRATPTRRRLDLRADQLIALDDSYNSFCVRALSGEVLCWESDQDPRPFAPLPRATQLRATYDALCDQSPGQLRCAFLKPDRDEPLAALLALPGAR